MKRWMALLFVSLLAAVSSPHDAHACSPIQEGWHINIPATPIVLPANGVLAFSAEAAYVSWEAVDPSLLEVVVNAPDGSVVDGSLEARMLNQCKTPEPWGCADQVLLLWRATSELLSDTEYQFSVRTWSRYNVAPGTPISEAAGRFTTTEAVSSPPSLPTLASALEVSVARKVLETTLCTESNDSMDCIGSCSGPPCFTYYNSLEDWVPSIVVTPTLAGELPANQILLRVAGEADAAWSATSPGVQLRLELPATAPSPWCLTLVAESLIDGSSVETEALCVSDVGLELGEHAMPRPNWCDPLVVAPSDDVSAEGDVADASSMDVDTPDDSTMPSSNRNDGGTCSAVVSSTSSTLPLVLLWGVMVLGIFRLRRRSHGVL